MVGLRYFLSILYMYMHEYMNYFYYMKRIRIFYDFLALHTAVTAQPGEIMNLFNSLKIKYVFKELLPKIVYELFYPTAHHFVKW